MVFIKWIMNLRLLCSVNRNLRRHFYLTINFFFQGFLVVSFLTMFYSLSVFHTFKELDFRVSPPLTFQNPNKYSPICSF